MKTNVSGSRIRLAFFLTFAWLAVSNGLGARLNVVATTPNIGAIVEEIGGDRIRLTVLARPGEDVRFVTPRPSFIPVLNRADLLIEGGADLETGWLPPLVRSARNRAILPGGAGHLALARHVELLEVPDGPIDRRMGDVHAAGNPHFLLDPKNGQVAARVITERLSELDAAGSDVYTANLDRFVTRLDEGMERWRSALVPYAGTRVVTYHKNYTYLARRFGFELVGEIEPLAGVEPSPRHIVGLIASMRERPVPMIWIEPFRPRRTPSRVAEQTGARLTPIPEQVGSVEGAGDYAALFEVITQRVVEAMKEAE